MIFRLIFCCAPFLACLLSCAVSAKPIDVQQIMREQAASTRMGELRHDNRRRTARVSRAKHRKVAARFKPSKIKTAPTRYSSPHSGPAGQLVSNQEPTAIKMASVVDNRPEQVGAAVSYGPDVHVMISDAFDAIDRLDRERSPLADAGQNAAKGNHEGNFFRWMWSGLRNTWRSLHNGG
jgi:hypothetical protein